MRQTCLKVCALIAAASLLPLSRPAFAQDENDFPTTTPIKHVIVIFQENVSFDHYFGTYPHAKANTNGTVFFQGAKDDTPRVNNLESSGLLTTNPNARNPFRIDRSVPNTCDQDHNYKDEEKAFHAGLMDNFAAVSCTDPVLGANSVMGYYDGNTVTALWNYAQHFAMSDNHYGTTFGPSTPGALNLISGQTFGATITNGLSGSGFIANSASSGAVVGDADPGGDKCSAPTRTQIQMSGLNVGDLLNNAGVTWGAFMGGFANCSAATKGISGLPATADYIPHHAWFQYYASTLNANHVGPSSNANIGRTDSAKHEYDLSLFFTALANHNLPAVSILKAQAFEDGHAGYSDPLDEQVFLVNTINTIMQSDEWKETAIIITWDDSDGWYDHQMGPIVRQSNVAEDQLVAPGSCGTANAAQTGGEIQNGRCGFGPRIPLVVISPYAKANYVDHKVVDQSSILRFIEDNFNLGRIGNGSTDAVAGTLDGLFDFDDGARNVKLILDPATGQIVTHDQGKDHENH